MGGHVSLLCIRWDFQCLDFGLSPSKHCRKVKAIFKAAAQLHTSVTQTDDSWPLIWSVELKYGIWAACLVDVSPIFSVKSFYHFLMFGGFPSENMPFFHPFCTHLFSLWSLQRWRRSGTGGTERGPCLSPDSEHSTSPLFPIAAALHKSRLRSFWFWYDEPQNFLQCELWASSASVSTVYSVTAFSKTFCPRSCNYYLIFNKLTFAGFLWSREVVFSALSFRGNWGTRWITSWFDRTPEHKFLLI